ncbi:hypothetical protein BKA63DRAFT_564146 [Paraphoma chrysanthemicola]|nr:hypothetical protein BKA63DRAFT_564146 [Paraphoma chrysanthemicola]
MSGHPKLIPAFTAKLKSGSPFPIGNAAGTSVQVFPITWGELRSVENFPIALNAEVQYGSDTVRIEPAQSHVRIAVNAVLKTQAGSHLVYKYHGIVKIDPAFMAIFAASPDAKSTDFGNAFTSIQFETGDEKLKALDHSIFVGSARFVVEHDGQIVIETKISQVVP